VSSIDTRLAWAPASLVGTGARAGRTLGVTAPLSGSLPTGASASLLGGVTETSKIDRVLASGWTLTRIRSSLVRAMGQDWRGLREVAARTPGLAAATHPTTARPHRAAPHRLPGLPMTLSLLDWYAFHEAPDVRNNRHENYGVTASRGRVRGRPETLGRRPVVTSRTSRAPWELPHDQTHNTPLPLPSQEKKTTRLAHPRRSSRPFPVSLRGCAQACANRDGHQQEVSFFWPIRQAFRIPFCKRPGAARGETPRPGSPGGAGLPGTLATTLWRQELADAVFLPQESSPCGGPKRAGANVKRSEPDAARPANLRPGPFPP
jgi:hypothetical protein